MKKMNLIGMSVVTAGLIVTGCGSSSSSTTTTDTGDAVINSLKQPMAMTDQNVTDVLNYLRNQFNQFGQMNLKAAAIKEKIAEVQDANFAGAAGEPEPCDISGFVTYTEIITDTPDAFGSEYKTTWDNCVNEDYYGSVDGVDMNRETRNGTKTDYWLESDNADTNVSSSSWGGADNYTAVYENNETAVVSRNVSSTYKMDWNHEIKSEDQADDFRRFTFIADGMRESKEVNASGDIISSSKNVAENFSTEEYALLDESAGTFTANGGMSYYYDGIAEDAIVFDNYLYEWTRMNQEKTVVINGSAGNLCLGGSVSLQTTTTMRENQVNYFDGSGESGSDVLPYDGNISLTGANSVTATVGFDSNESNYTSATVSIGGGESQTYDSWSAMTSEWDCSINTTIRD